MSTTDPGSSLAPSDIVDRRSDDDLFVLDVRNESDYDEWHIDGSHNLPVYDQLLDENYLGLEASLGEIPDDSEIAVVCVAGVTSARAAEFLRDQGYDAKSLEEGMNGWGRLHVTYAVDSVPGVAQIVRPGTGCISYLVFDGDEGVAIDPSLYTDEYVAVASAHGVEITATVDTHTHADHLSGAPGLAAELDIPYYLHPADSGSLDVYTPLEGGQTIPVGSREVRVRHTPGHTPGSVSIEFGNALLTGDTLFIRGVGRPDLEGSDGREIEAAANRLYDSLSNLATLSDERIVLPGHFSDEDMRPLVTDIGNLKRKNDLFGMDDRAAFVDTVIRGLSDEPANYNQIKSINWGMEPMTEEAPSLELGPNNCAAN